MSAKQLISKSFSWTFSYLYSQLISLFDWLLKVVQQYSQTHENLEIRRKIKNYTARCGGDFHSNHWNSAGAMTFSVTIDNSSMSIARWNIFNTVNGTQEASLNLWLKISIGIWWYVVVMAMLLTLFYLCALVRLVKDDEFRKQTTLITIISINTLLQITITISTLYLQRFPHAHICGIGIDTKILLEKSHYREVSHEKSLIAHVHFPSSLSCKVSEYLCHVCEFYTNWAWFLLMWKRFLAIYYPFKHHKFKPFFSWLLPLIILAAFVAEFWIPIVTSQFKMDDLSFCYKSSEWIGTSVLGWLNVTEILISYLIPATLGIFADAIVSIRRYPPGLFTSVSRWKSPSYGSVQIIVSRKSIPDDYHMKGEKKRQQAMGRALLCGTIHLLFKLLYYYYYYYITRNMATSSSCCFPVSANGHRPP